MRSLELQRRLAAEIAGVGKSRVKFDPERLKEIKEAITREDVRALIKSGAIIIEKPRGISRGRARKLKEQKRKGRRRGPGSRKGKYYSKLSRKERWMRAVRAQRKFLKALKEKGRIDKKMFKELYRKVKGGFFRSVSHIKLYLEKVSK